MLLHAQDTRWHPVSTRHSPRRTTIEYHAWLTVPWSSEVPGEDEIALNPERRPSRRDHRQTYFFFREYVPVISIFFTSRKPSAHSTHVQSSVSASFTAI